MARRVVELEAPAATAGTAEAEAGRAGRLRCLATQILSWNEQQKAPNPQKQVSMQKV